MKPLLAEPMQPQPTISAPMSEAATASVCATYNQVTKSMKTKPLTNFRISSSLRAYRRTVLFQQLCFLAFVMLIAFALLALFL
jgi:hypothetical protein